MTHQKKSLQLCHLCMFVNFTLYSISNLLQKTGFWLSLLFGRRYAVFRNEKDSFRIMLLKFKLELVTIIYRYEFLFRFKLEKFYTTQTQTLSHRTLKTTELRFKAHFPVICPELLLYWGGIEKVALIQSYRSPSD